RKNEPIPSSRRDNPDANPPPSPGNWRTARTHPRPPAIRKESAPPAPRPSIPFPLPPDPRRSNHAPADPPPSPREDRQSRHPVRKYLSGESFLLFQRSQQVHHIHMNFRRFPAGIHNPIFSAMQPRLPQIILPHLLMIVARPQLDPVLFHTG